MVSRPDDDAADRELTAVEIAEDAAERAFPFTFQLLGGPVVHAPGLSKLEWMAGMVASVDRDTPPVQIVSRAERILEECRRVEDLRSSEE